MKFSKYLSELFKPKQLGTVRGELSGYNSVDTRNDGWKYELISSFKEYGFNLIGQGKYGIVFSHPKLSYIVKVFMKDSAFLRWWKFCMQHQDNPFCPKFRGKIGKLSNNFYTLRVEKLSPTQHQAFSEFQSQLRAYPGKVPEDKHVAEVVEFLHANKDLLDLHGENVMMRGNQLVIIDPFYNWFNKTKPMAYTIDPEDFDYKDF